LKTVCIEERGEGGGGRGGGRQTKRKKDGQATDGEGRFIDRKMIKKTK
jgi:hypothetical protein